MENLFNFAKGVIYALFIYLGIKTGIVKILFYLMLLDTVLGIVKAIRLEYKFSFKRLAWGMVSKLTILIIPMVVALIGKGFSFDLNYFVVAVMNIIIVSEGISCITNIISIRTKKQIENSDYITLLLYSIRRGLMKIVTKLLGVVEGGKIDNKNNSQ